MTLLHWMDPEEGLPLSDADTWMALHEIALRLGQEIGKCRLRMEQAAHQAWPGLVSRVMVLSARLDTTRAERDRAWKVLEKVTGALNALKLRIVFIGWPNESMWEPNGVLVPDWRSEIKILEEALAAVSALGQPAEPQAEVGKR